HRLTANHAPGSLVCVQIPTLASVSECRVLNLKDFGFHRGGNGSAIGVPVNTRGAQLQSPADRQGNEPVVSQVGFLAVNIRDFQAGPEVDPVSVPDGFFQAVIATEQNSVVGNAGVLPGQALATGQGECQQEGQGGSGHYWLLGVSCGFPCESDLSASINRRSRP